MRILFFILVLMFVACGGNPANPEVEAIAQSKENIAALEEQVFARTDRPIDNDQGGQLMSAYLEFSNLYRQDTMAPEYMFKAAELAMNLRRLTIALEVLDNLLSSFPAYRKAPDVANWRAYIYDFELADKGKAREAYELIIARFPNHRYADDARARLETLHMTDEQWLEWAKSKNPEPTATE